MVLTVVRFQPGLYEKMNSKTRETRLMKYYGTRVSAKTQTPEGKQSLVVDYSNMCAHLPSIHPGLMRFQK